MEFLVNSNFHLSNINAKGVENYINSVVNNQKPEVPNVRINNDEFVKKNAKTKKIIKNIGIAAAFIGVVASTILVFKKLNVSKIKNPNPLGTSTKPPITEAKPKITSIFENSFVKQKPSNFCHGATSLLAISKHKGVSPFLNEILQQKVQKTKDDEWVVKMARNISYKITLQELDNVPIEGPTELKVLGRAYEKYLMQQYPTEYIANGEYNIQALGDVHDFFLGIFGVPCKASSVDASGCKNVFGKYFNKQSGFSAEKDLIFVSGGGHWYFVDSIKDGVAAIREPFNPEHLRYYSENEFFNFFNAGKVFSIDDIKSKTL